jgi:hypothetical protein
MAISPLPDIRKLRTVLMSVLGAVYLLLILSMPAWSARSFELELVFVLAVFLSAMWILQWVVFSGEAMPEVRSSIGLVAFLALVLGCIDAALVTSWNMLALTSFGWIRAQDQDEWTGFFMLAGFMFGVALVAYAGWRLSRYDFLALMLLLHVIGGACQGAMLILPIRHRETFIDGYIHTTTSEILSGVSILATILVLWWGIAPITYLIAYRGYRRRLAAWEAAEPSSQGGGQQGVDL